MIAALLLALAAQAPPPPDSALRVLSAVAPETVTVGDPFRSVLRIAAPPGARVEFFGLELGDSVQPVDTVAAIRGGGPMDGATAVYRAVAWVAGAPIDGRVRVRVTAPGGPARDFRVPLRLPVVRSVLPADTAGVEPRPPRAPLPLPPGPPLWPWLAGAALLVSGAGLWAWRRRPARPAAPGDPRAAALAAMDAGFPAESPSEVADRAARALRRYLAALEPEWGEAWSTAELLARIDPGTMAPSARAGLAPLLAELDTTRFAGRPLAVAEAERLRQAARRWVESYPPPPAVQRKEAA